MSNAMGLKAKIRNIAQDKNIPAQVILQNYMFERLLVRLAQSEYREKFVLKGGRHKFSDNRKKIATRRGGDFAIYCFAMRYICLTANAI